MWHGFPSAARDPGTGSPPSSPPPPGPPCPALPPCAPTPAASAHCRCHDDPPVLHGPYAEWTRKIEGKTVTRRLTPEQLAAWQPLFDNARKMRDLLARIQDLTLQAVDADDT